MNIHNSSSNNNTCETCGETFLDKNELLSHLNTHVKVSNSGDTHIVKEVSSKSEQLLSTSENINDLNVNNYWQNLSTMNNSDISLVQHMIQNYMFLGYLQQNASIYNNLNPLYLGFLGKLEDLC